MSVTEQVTYTMIPLERITSRLPVRKISVKGVCPVMQKPDATYPWKSPIETAKMVYWSISKLIHLASLEELFSYDPIPTPLETRKVKLTPKQIAIIQNLPETEEAV